MLKLKGFNLNNLENKEVPMPDYIYDQIVEFKWPTSGIVLCPHYIGQNDTRSQMRNGKIDESHSLLTNMTLANFARFYYGTKFNREKAKNKKTLRVSDQMSSYKYKQLVYLIADNMGGKVLTKGNVNIEFDSNISAENFNVKFYQIVNKLYSYYWE